MSSPFVDLDGNPIPEDQILGYGRTGLVVLRGETAVKLPIRWRRSSDVDVQLNIKALQHEQDIYQRLGKCDGVVPYISFSETTTQLALMKNGDLRTYLTRNRPSRSLQLLWFREMARALAQIHDRRVIVADIASRNFLLDSDLSIKFCDFTESTKMPLDTHMETANDNGYSIRTDIGQLGAVMYEVVTGERCEFDLFKDVPLEVGCAAWPRRETLPSTQGIWLGPVIEKCWTEGAFHNAHDLLKELESVSIENEPIHRLEPCQDPGPLKRMTVQAWHCLNAAFKHNAYRQPVTMLAVTFSAIAFLTTWVWRRSRV